MIIILPSRKLNPPQSLLLPDRTYRTKSWTCNFSYICRCRFSPPPPLKFSVMDLLQGLVLQTTLITKPGPPGSKFGSHTQLGEPDPGPRISGGSGRWWCSPWSCRCTRCILFGVCWLVGFVVHVACYRFRKWTSRARARWFYTSLLYEGQNVTQPVFMEQVMYTLWNLTLQSSNVAGWDFREFGEDINSWKFVKYSKKPCPDPFSLERQTKTFSRKRSPPPLLEWRFWWRALLLACVPISCATPTSQNRWIACNSSISESSLEIRQLAHQVSVKANVNFTTFQLPGRPAIHRPVLEHEWEKCEIILPKSFSENSYKF